MIYLYTIISTLIFLVCLPGLPFVYLFSKKRRMNLLPRLGIFTGLVSDPDKKTIWIHALSVGEVKSSVPVVKQIKERFSDKRVVFTASTITGFQTAQSLFIGIEDHAVDQIGYFPFDFWWSVKRVIKKINPEQMVLIETDLWPRFLYEMNKKRIPVILANARLSDRSYKRYSKIRPIASLFFSRLDRICAQADEDRHRYIHLGVDPERITVTGNIKFDQPEPSFENSNPDQLRVRLGIDQNRAIIIAGSTHEGEEQILMTWLKNAIETTDNLLLVIAPRDPVRSQSLLNDAEKLGLNAILYSQMETSKKRLAASVVLVDKMGELSKLYAVCDIAIIGGSMVNEGGHNPLEAAVYAKPILFGSDMSDFKEISRLLIENNGAKVIRSERELENTLDLLLNDKDTRKNLGENSRRVFRTHQGAVERIMTVIGKISRG